MTEAVPDEPLLIRTDSAWTMAGGLLLLQGYKPDARWESGNLWRRWARALRGRDPAHQVFLQKVKAHVDESHFARGIITRAEAEGNERADELAGLGRGQHTNTAEAEQRAADRSRVQWKLLRCCAHILEAREAKLKELQSGETAAAAPPPLCPTASPWTRSLEAPTVCFRGMADEEARQEVLRDFSGGEKLGQELLDYFACCR